MVLLGQIYRVSERLSFRGERFLDGNRHSDVQEGMFDRAVVAPQWS